MNHDEFVKFFYGCFELLPQTDRTVILAYWRKWKVSAEIVTDDEKILQLSRKTIKAAVTGRVCLHQFLFRNYVVNFAPESVQRTIILHELAHCFDYGKRPWKRRGPDQEDPSPSLTTGGQAMQKVQKCLVLMETTLMDEEAASRKNLKWGSDETAAHEWCDRYILQNSLT